MRIPGLLDISPSNLILLDERDAYEHFFEKTLVEAAQMFREPNHHIYVDDLMWMGSYGFEYYLKAYILALRESGDVCEAMYLAVARFGIASGSTKELATLISEIERKGEAKCAECREWFSEHVELRIRSEI